MNTKGIGEHMLLIGLSNKTKDLTHPAKSTRPEPSIIQPNYLVVGGGSYYPKPISTGWVADLPFHNPIHPTWPWCIIFNAQGSQFSHSFLVLRLSLTLSISQHLQYVPIHTDISISPSFQRPSLPIYVVLSTSIIANLRWALNLHHCRSALISQPPSSPICNSLPFTIVDLQSLPFTIFDLRVKFVVFSYFLFISLFQSHASPVSIFVLWICGLLVFGFVDLFFSVDLFFQICEICGLWSLSFGWNWIRPLCTQAWSDSTRDFSWSTVGSSPCHPTRSGRFRVEHKPKLNRLMNTPTLL